MQAPTVSCVDRRKVGKDEPGKMLITCRIDSQASATEGPCTCDCAACAANKQLIKQHRGKNESKHGDLEEAMEFVQDGCHRTQEAEQAIGLGEAAVELIHG